MQVSVELPDDIVDIALEGYRTGRLAEEQVRRLLGLESRLQVHAFLKEHLVYDEYIEQDLDRDLENARKFSQPWSSSPTPPRSTNLS